MSNQDQSKRVIPQDPDIQRLEELYGVTDHVRMAEELHILVEMVFGINHSDLDKKEKSRLKDLHDVINHYRQRASGKELDISEAVGEHRERVIQIMETYRWVIHEARSRYSKSQLKYVDTLLTYLENVQDIISSYIATTV